MPLKALIFDFDGLILDTERPIYDAWLESYEAYGVELPLGTYVGCVGSDFNGFDPKSYLEKQIGRTLDWTALDLTRAARAREIIATNPPMPGVLDLLEAAKSRDIPAAVASSSSRDWVEPWLEKLALRDYFSLTRCLDDVSRPKPSPELFLAAAEGLGVAPAEALVLEDSLNGLHAAQAAGCPCLAVPNAITTGLDFTGAVRRIESLSEITLEELLALDVA